MVLPLEFIRSRGIGRGGRRSTGLRGDDGSNVIRIGRDRVKDTVGSSGARTDWFLYSQGLSGPCQPVPAGGETLSTVV